MTDQSLESQQLHEWLVEHGHMGAGDTPVKALIRWIKLELEQRFDRPVLVCTEGSAEWPEQEWWPREDSRPEAKEMGHDVAIFVSQKFQGIPHTEVRCGFVERFRASKKDLAQTVVTVRVKAHGSGLRALVISTEGYSHV